MIYYILETELSGKNLLKMQESIPPLIEKITDIMESVNSTDEFISELEELSYRVIEWKTSKSNLPEFQVEIDISSLCTIILNVKDIERDMKIRKILE